MKSYGVHCILLLVACLLIFHEAASRRKACPYRQGCGARWVRLSAAAVCRHFAETESSFRSCHCQAPSSRRCRRLCAFREQIAKCAREYLCPPPTTTATTSTTSTTSATSPMTCGSQGACVADCPGDVDLSGTCSGGLICCVVRCNRSATAFICVAQQHLWGATYQTLTSLRRPVYDVIKLRAHIRIFRKDFMTEQ